MKFVFKLFSVEIQDSSVGTGTGCGLGGPDVFPGNVKMLFFPRVSKTALGPHIAACPMCKSKVISLADHGGL
jgi:hypothetical protein